MNWENFEGLMQQKNELEKEVKRRCMIFDCHCKERIAKELDLDFWYFHNTAFDPWILIKKTFDKGDKIEALRLIKVIDLSENFDCDERTIEEMF